MRGDIDMPNGRRIYNAVGTKPILFERISGEYKDNPRVIFHICYLIRFSLFSLTTFYFYL